MLQLVTTGAEGWLAGRWGFQRIFGDLAHYAVSPISSDLPYNRRLRRLLSIAILLVIAAPAIAPLFVLSATTGGDVPACCRRNGKHHCMMSEAQRAAMSEGREHLVAQVGERCPFQPKASPATRNLQTIADADSAVFTGLVIHPVLTPQSRCLQRISFQDSHQRRGPPAELS